MMIDGLKISFTGAELRELLDERAAEYRASAARWHREAKRTSEDQTEDAPLLPQHICKNQVAQDEWRAERLEFLSERVNVSEVYALSLGDLEYVELMPAEPEMLGPYDFDDDIDDESDLGPYVKRIGMSADSVLVTNPDAAE